MARHRNVDTIVDRYNQGVEHFENAEKAWRAGNMRTYESLLRSATVDTVGALEWALKWYLRNVGRGRMGPDDQSSLRQPTFFMLVELMERFAEPSLSDQQASRLLEYRSALRNSAEHSASVPPVGHLLDAIAEIRHLLIVYLGCEPSELKTSGDAEQPVPGIPREELDEYYGSVVARFEYMDLGGISPRVGGKVVRIRMAELFVPLKAIPEDTLFEENLDAGAPSAPHADSPRDVLLMPVSHSGGARPVELADVLEYNRLIILGHPGSGKTTIGKYIAFSVASETDEALSAGLEGYVPIMLRASEFGLSLLTNPSRSLYDYVVNGLSERFGNLYKSALELGRAIVIVDGLDEITLAGKRGVVARRIEDFVAEFSANSFVITSRIVGYRQNRLVGAFRHVSLSELDNAQVYVFLQNWFAAIESESSDEDVQQEIERRAAALHLAILSNPGIRKLAGNPLLLTIIALANWRGTRLPTRRVELYQIATETLVENWPLKQRGISVDASEILTMLEPIAFHMFSTGRVNLITEREFRPLFEAQIAELRGGTPNHARTLSRDILLTIEEHTGFFLERGTDEHGQRAYGFLHLTFAEYLSARFLAEQWSSHSVDFAEYIADHKWHEVLLLMGGHVGTWGRTQATHLLREIRRSSTAYEEYLHRSLILAAEILADNVRVQRDVQDELVRDLVNVFTTTPFASIRGAAFGVFCRIVLTQPLGGARTYVHLDVRDNEITRYRKSTLAWIIEPTNPELFLELVRSFSIQMPDQGSLHSFMQIVADARLNGPGNHYHCCFETSSGDLVSFGTVPEHLVDLLRHEKSPHIRVDWFGETGWTTEPYDVTDAALVLSVASNESVECVSTSVLASALSELGGRSYLIQDALLNSARARKIVRELKRRMRDRSDLDAVAETIIALANIYDYSIEVGDGFGTVRFDSRDRALLKQYVTLPQATLSAAALRLLQLELSGRSVFEVYSCAAAHESDAVRATAVSYAGDAAFTPLARRMAFALATQILKGDRSPSVRAQARITALRSAPESQLPQIISEDWHEGSVPNMFIYHLVSRALRLTSKALEEEIGEALISLLRRNEVAMFIVNGGYFRSLSERRLPKIAAKLRTLLSSDDRTLVRAATRIWFLFRTPGEASDTICELLASGDPVVIQILCEHLDKNDCTAEMLLATLRSLLHSESLHVVRSVAIALKRVGDPHLLNIARAQGVARLAANPADPIGFHLLSLAVPVAAEGNYGVG